MENKFGSSYCKEHWFENRATRRAHRFGHPIRMKRINKRKQRQARK